MFTWLRKLARYLPIPRRPSMVVFTVVSSDNEWRERFHGDAGYFEAEMETSNDERAEKWPRGLLTLHGGYYNGERAIEASYNNEICTPQQIRDFLAMFGLVLQLALTTKSFSNIVRSRP